MFLHNSRISNNITPIPTSKLATGYFEIGNGLLYGKAKQSEGGRCGVHWEDIEEATKLAFECFPGGLFFRLFIKFYTFWQMNLICQMVSFF